MNAKLKHLLLTTIAAVVLVGCGKPSNPEADRVLIDAVKQGNIEAVKYRLAIGTDIELKCTGCGGTALFHAAELENKVVVELLIKAGAEVDAKDDGGRAPLFAAIYFGQKENAELLIANGADVNAETTSGMSLLDMALSKKHEELINLIKASGGSSNADQSIHVASNIGDLRAVKKHLDAGSDVNARDDRTGGTPLHCAVAFGHKETAELLIAEGADVNAKDNQSGNTPLHTAARNGRKEIGELLTEHGADVNAKNDDGITPLGRAIEYRQIKIANFLRKNGSKMEETTKIKAPNISIYQAAEHGRIDAVKYYLAAGVDVNVKMKNILGTTPLHEAVRKNRKEIVELLIAEGANVNARDGSGETALYQAAHRGYLELCKLLINNGADLDISTSKITMGHSPLYFAIRNRHADVAELLITSGADVNIKNGFGESPMDMAVHAKLQNIVNLLIEHGAETSALKGKEKTNETAKPTAFTHMPEIDLSSLPEEQRKTILERANKEGCNCGCKMTVAECRNDDTTCRRSVALAKAIVKEVTGEKLEEEVKSEARKTGEELKAEGK